MAPERCRREIAIRGIVQGVGFRPFVCSLARRHGLTGWVRNDADGVQIEAEGLCVDLDDFLLGIESEPPPLAMVEHVSWRPCAARGDREFRIEESRAGGHRHALISPDFALCADCLREMFDPADRRYRYPFINCTNCGPRFTITRSVPYDRAMTTMADFAMCADCLDEYKDPLDRRFHAQPNACAKCGPQVSLNPSAEGKSFGGDAVPRAAELLRGGAILAVKGLGGYHLACDPFSDRAVVTLRERKARQDKPFALMARDLEQARTLCRISAEEEALLTSPARPIVLLERLKECGVAEAVAPRQTTLGVMLAYTPLHHLLLHDAGMPLVMTSGNHSDEPIAYRDEDARSQLRHIADGFLTHNRAIYMRCDDSIARSMPTGTMILRRSRGYAPAPLRIPARFQRHLLACGAHLNNTFCVAKEDHVFLSHHIGDLENYETLRSFREGIAHYCRLFDVRPEVVAFDLHPEYLSTKYARELEEEGMEAVSVQHHHAHIASCLADNERPEDEAVIGVAFDGTGYGADGALWGGEFLTGSIRSGFSRAAHLRYMPLPGGEAAIRAPWRSAVAQLIRLYGEADAMRLPLSAMRCAGEANVRHIARMLEHGLNTPITSSAGRLFDAVAAIAGVPGSLRTTYEGQAAIELEMAAGGVCGNDYRFHLRRDCGPLVVETDDILRGVVEDAISGKSPGEIAGRFHGTMAGVAVAACLEIRDTGGPSAAALSGGVFQNTLLLKQTCSLLSERGFTVYTHRRVPTNDGGICLGQAVLANCQISRQ